MAYTAQDTSPQGDQKLPLDYYVNSLNAAIVLYEEELALNIVKQADEHGVLYDVMHNKKIDLLDKARAYGMYPVARKLVEGQSPSKQNRLRLVRSNTARPS